MYTRNAGNQPIFWQGPSIGFDAGADGDRTMMLVYNLPETGAIFDRFGGLDGSAYFIGGLGFTAVGAKGVVVVPIRTGVGLALWGSISTISSSRSGRPGIRSDRAATDTSGVKPSGTDSYLDVFCARWRARGRPTGGSAMIIDCHGHYTTAPKALGGVAQPADRRHQGPRPGAQGRGTGRSATTSFASRSKRTSCA